MAVLQVLERDLMAQFSWDKENKKVIRITNEQQLTPLMTKNFTESHKIDYDKLTDEQLAELAISKGFDLSKYKTRKTLIKALGE